MAQEIKLGWSTQTRKVKELKTWDANPRKISKEKLQSLKEKIIARGVHDVLIIDRDNTILSGNQRQKVLIELNINEVTVLVPDRALTLDERIKIALESNKHDGEWDFELLKSFDFDLLTNIGFDEIDLKFWDGDLDVKEEDFNVEKELKKITEPTTKLGDIIQLGSHKLICGDSTDPNVLKKLFGDDKASMVYSDPVYNIKVDYNKGIGGKQRYGGNVMDNRTDTEYKEFIKKSLDCALSVSNKDLHLFYWCDESYIWLFQTIYRELGINNRRVCLWLKNGQNPTPSVAFNKCYEPCVYGTIGNPFLHTSSQNFNEILNKEMSTGNNLISEIDDHMSVWVEKRLSSKDYEHATSKPPKLHEKAIRRCTKPNDIILDSFSGSGSTLIAGEQLKRRVYGVELEPAFCDLTIRRFEKLTGMKAKIIRDHEES